jgi:hypothetical protein
VTSRSRDAGVGPLIALLGLVLSATGCIPTQSTIGGHDEATIRQWERDASEMCLLRAGERPPQRFTTDGCTLSPDGTWQSCCVEHDMSYWCGGSAEARLEADAKFRACVAGKGGHGAAEVMYWGVRLGGHPWIPGYWRWGYGWPWPRGYTGGKRP